MLCPVCKVELRIVDRQGVEVDYCPQCRGVWLDRGELDKLIERSVTMAGPPAARPVESREYERGYPPPAYGSHREYDDDDHERRQYHGKRRRRGWLDDIFDFD